MMTQSVFFQSSVWAGSFVTYLGRSDGQWWRTPDWTDWNCHPGQAEGRSNRKQDIQHLHFCPYQCAAMWTLGTGEEPLCPGDICFGKPYFCNASRHITY